MTGQEGPRGKLLERRNAMIETHQIGSRVKKKEEEEEKGKEKRKWTLY